MGIPSGNVVGITDLVVGCIDHPNNRGSSSGGSEDMVALQIHA